MLSRLVMGNDSSLAVIGLAKNAGKTTVLNALSREAAARKIPAALVSIGVDGEERDVWSGREKPPVHVPAGFLAATAAPLFEERPGDWQVHAVTSLRSPLGPVAVARALRRTRIKLAGVTTAGRVRETETLFREHGARLTLVDGAYDRKAAASPWVTEAAVCVAGASMGRSLDEVVRRTGEAVRMLTLPAATDPLLLQAAKTAQATGRLAGVRNGRVEPLPFPSLLSGWERLRETLSEEGWSGLALPGALTDASLDRLASMGLSLCVAEPTRCFTSLDGLRRYARTGGEVLCLRALALRAVAVNPVSPGGWSFDPEAMRERIQAVCGPIPVLDVCREDQTASD